MAELFKKFSILFFIMFLSNLYLPAFSYELDISVDEEIRNKYDIDKIEQDILNNTLNSSIKNTSGKNDVSKVNPDLQLDYSSVMPEISAAEKKFYRKIPKWTTFIVKSDQTISNYTAKGTKVTFTSVEPVYKKNVTIPAGTKFYGEISNSHPPQITGNGGLIIIKITAVSYNGQTYPFNGKITKAVSKKIFFNRIKGKRQYLAGIGKHIDKGENFYKKTRQISSKMSDIPVIALLSPVPTVIGIAGYASVAVVSPVTALGVKGGNLSIPAGSNLSIRLLDGAYVN